MDTPRVLLEHYLKQLRLPTVLREFKDSFPLYGITVVPGETPDTQERLENGVLDLAISLKPASGPLFIQRRSFEIFIRLTATTLSWPESSTAVSWQESASK